jgi:hypothetical protein
MAKTRNFSRRQSQHPICPSLDWHNPGWRTNGPLEQQHHEQRPLDQVYHPSMCIQDDSVGNTQNYAKWYFLEWLFTSFGGRQCIVLGWFIPLIHILGSVEVQLMPESEARMIFEMALSLRMAGSSNLPRCLWFVRAHLRYLDLEWCITSTVFPYHFEPPLHELLCHV